MTTTTTTTTADEIEHEFFPFLRLYKSGRLERIIESPFLPASFDPSTSVVSKDITIQSPHTHHPLILRLYLPSNLPPHTKLPILLYFHGGGFCIETPFSPTYHPYLNSLVSAANLLAVSVHYRRLPHDPLPAAYDDSFSALSYLSSPSDADPWISHFADHSRLFLAGDSAGANIAHHIAVRAAAAESRLLLPIKGVALIHPYFWREKNEGMERVWRLLNIRGTTEGVEDPMLNPWVGPGVGGLRKCGKVAVSVAERDFLRGVGVEYVEKLKEEGVVVEVWETEEENHVFHLTEPGTEAARAEMERMVRFLTSAEVGLNS